MGLQKEAEMNEDDKGLQEELLNLVSLLTGKDEKVILPSLVQLRIFIQTSTTSMTSVPKPLKYLRNSYGVLKTAQARLKCKESKAQFADILSVLAMAGDTSGLRECLKYCLQGTMHKPGDWGHEYVRQLEAEITEEWTDTPNEEEDEMKEKLLPLVKSIIEFDMQHNAEIQACDLCMEIDQLDLLDDHLNDTNFGRVCLYLGNCAGYSEEMERLHILKIVTNYYLRFNQYTRAMLVALQIPDSESVYKCLITCPNCATRKQLALLLARQQDRPLRKEYHGDDAKDIETILSNSQVNGHFQMLARELDILEPKHPEDIYKSWLETGGPRISEIHDSARANLASSYVSGFVHAGFGLDKLMANTEDCWVYKNKDHGMLAATASLGLIHLWDVDGGLVPIDKYLYTSDDIVKSGALLAMGLVNCGVRNECDPALALLSEYVLSDSQTLRIGAIMGLGLAYAGSRRSDVSDLLTGALTDQRSSMEIVSLAAIALGLVNVGSANSDVSHAILQKQLEFTPQEWSVTYSRFIPLALGLVYMGCRDMIATPSTALEVLPEPHRFASQTMLQICAYAGTGDVLIIQELLSICSEPVEGENSSSILENTPVPSSCDPKIPESLSTSTLQGTSTDANKEAKTKSACSLKNEGIYKDMGLPQAIASLGVGVVGLGEGKENARIFGQVGRYGSAAARRAVPLAMALNSLSDPEPALLDVLKKYSHDNDPEVAYNAIFALGLVGAGTNNARLATMLRQLAAYHAKNPSHLFLVRISQGLVHLGKGTLSLSPLHYASKVLDQTALAGLLVIMVACLDSTNLILGKSHYLMYCLTVAMEPRWLVTLDENMKTLPVSVRVGQAVDIIGKAGSPKSIAGGRVHTTPVLLAHGERAELVSDQYQPLSSVLEGFVILKEN
ncbi:26S proteasome non-ATPase regulatory subunit 2 [Cephus cinctus]|uniref:26S proteasome non-ATPase regulatory subunit 2 n=1 Tax=Cephus cinctus TaxID=211228 RepID=A0AAJ7RJP0_CEPCN|nr:26S proteasome non-ATPase regulatory subunit 2 [Cephus cinctus]